MSDALKTILNDVLGESGFIKKGGFAASADPDDIQMMAMANKAAREIRDYYNWSQLRKTYKLTMQDNQERYTLPEDFYSIVRDSAWETDGSRQVEIPTPNGRWFIYKYTAYSDGGLFRGRLYGNELEIHDPQGGQEFNFEYISKWVVANQNGGLKEAFNLDDDVFILDDELLRRGTQYHWAISKGFPQAAVWGKEYNDRLKQAIGRDEGAKTVGGVPTEEDWLSTRVPYSPTYLP